MEVCKKCGEALPPGARFCPSCGKEQEPRRGHRKRGNGQGTISVTPSGKYMLTVTVGYETDEQGKRHRKSRSRVFATKREAVAAVSELLAERKQEKQAVTFKALYDRWLPTHRAGKSTIDCYKAAVRYFEPIWHEKIADIDIDDLQECVDSCPRGKRTRENMRAVCGLVYKYGIPRKVIPDNLNLAPFIAVDGDAASHRDSFTDVEIERIRQAVGKVDYADVIYCMIYTGFRPSEFLALSAADYNRSRGTLTGGSKTEAGKNRTVTISPKIQPILAAKTAEDGPLFGDPAGKYWELKNFTETAFYPALAQIGIDNPLVEVGGGVKRHRVTPHTCRHTFATLMKRVDGSDKDKLELIGHASAEMLRYYQDVDLADLRRITDAI